MGRWPNGKPTEAWLAEMLARDPTDECVLWPFTKDGRGYPTVGGSYVKTQKVSHLVLERTGRPRPEGLIALHSCDVRACVNPRHLSWGTYRENAEQMVARGRHYQQTRSKS